MKVYKMLAEGKKIRPVAPVWEPEEYITIDGEGRVVDELGQSVNINDFIAGTGTECWVEYFHKEYKYVICPIDGEEFITASYYSSEDELSDIFGDYSWLQKLPQTERVRKWSVI